MATNMATTPRKETKIDCFGCLTENDRILKLNGRKLTSENFVKDLKLLVGNEYIISQLQNSNTGVCRNCYTKVRNTTDFIKQLNTSVNSFISSPYIVKRSMLSPLTPKSVCTGNNSSQNTLSISSGCDVVQSKSRKRIKVGLTFEENKNVSPIHETPPPHQVTEVSDHTYAERNSLKNKTDPALEIIQLSCEKILHSKENADINDLRSHSRTLTSRTTMLASVLFKYRETYTLVENADNLLHDIVLEMKNRLPHLLDVMCSVAVPDSGKISPSIIPVLAACYSILMKHKYNNLSAFHRLTSAIATEGGLNDRGQTRLNHLGIMLSSQRRMKFQECIGDASQKLIVESLKSNPLLKVTGDNLDIYIKRSKLTSDNRNLDLHLFTSNVIFSRIATIDMNNDVPRTDKQLLSADDVLLKCSGAEREKLMYVYSILLSRILIQIPYFQTYKKLIPEHIPHEYSQKMSVASKVMPLPIQFKNETKHEDCLAIMDMYETQLVDLYQAAFGNLEFLRKYRIPVGGDQLTRVRLQEAKNLRSISVTPERRLEDLHPVVCEMWHNKQDMLEKCFKRLYNSEHSPGTLSFFKTILHRTNVNGKVKGRFQPHFDLLMNVGEGLVQEQFMEFFQMENKYDKPKHNCLNDIGEKSAEEQKTLLLTVVTEFMNYYGYCNADTASGLPKPLIGTVRYELQQKNGKRQLVQTREKPQTDELFNYCMQLCHWFMHILELQDTAKEGDLNRTVLNCKYSIPFFFFSFKIKQVFG